MNQINALTQAIDNHFSWHKSRKTLLKEMIASAIKTGHVYHKKFAECVEKNVNVESTVRRIQRFFSEQQIDYIEVGRIILDLLNLKDNLILAMDRTNWEFGTKDVNYLVISVIYDSTSIPLVWIDLNKKGNSNTEERKDLIDLLLNIVDSSKIKALIGDREFEGEEWFDYLKNKKIKFFIRLKSSHLLKHKNGGRLKAKEIFKELKIKETITKKDKIMGIQCQVTALRLERDLLIVASNDLDIEPEKILRIYKDRWKIETLFKNMKTKGFNIEETHMKDKDKLEKLFMILTFGCAICILAGKIKNYLIKIIIKKNGRFLYSLFTYGIDFLKNTLFTPISSFKNKYLYVAIQIYT